MYSFYIRDAVLFAARSLEIENARKKRVIANDKSRDFFISITLFLDFPDESKTLTNQRIMYIPDLIKQSDIADNNSGTVAKD